MTITFPPGPKDHSFGLSIMAQMKRDVLGAYLGLHREYGDAVSFRTGPYRMFMFFHPDQVREVLVTSAKSTVRFPRVMETFAQWNSRSVLIAEGEPWAQQRRLVQPVFQPRAMEGCSRVMVQSAQDVIASWTPELERSGYIDVDVDQTMTNLTLAIICRALFDADVSEQSVAIGQAVAELSRVAFNEMQAPVRLPAWIPTPQNLRKRKAIATLDGVVWKFINDFHQSNAGGLLARLINSEDPSDGGARLSRTQVRDEATTLMLAGHDTTAAAFDWLWYCLAKDPSVAVRCRAEIADAIGDREPRFEDVANLPVLTATIRETLRLYPPAFALFMRQATENLTIGSYHVPRGSLIAISPFVTQRDARWFAEPERFDSDRFLPPRVNDIRPHAYFPFGAGPRACIGQAFAMNELMLVAATILQKFTVTLMPSHQEPTLNVTMALRPKETLTLRFNSNR